MIPLWLMAVVIVAQVGVPRSQVAWPVATAMRAAAMILLTWMMLMPRFGGWIMFPIAIFGWLAFGWTTLISSAWPAYVDAHSKWKSEPVSAPDHRATPMVLGTALGCLLAGLALASTVWLLVSELLEQSGSVQLGWEPTLKATLLNSLVISGAIVAFGLITFVLGRLRDPWYPAQRAYLNAALRRSAERLEGMRAAVELAPADAKPTRLFWRR